jgi:hypothetical protein
LIKNECSSYVTRSISQNPHFFFYPRILLENGYHLNSIGVRVIVIRGDHENKKKYK